MGIRTRARSLARRTADRDANLGHADRLVRACLALSLLMLGGFSLALASGLSLFGVVFCGAALYCVVTATLGTDPLYLRAGIDTREAWREAEDAAPGGHDEAFPVLTGGGDHTR